MDFPDFFAAAPTITLRDPLAAFLGAPRSGVISYSFADAVKLAGHSCPTVAGAYLLVRRGLAHLYGGDLPERGAVEVHMRGGRDEGTTGVTAAVATLLTGAAAETGFAGIGADHRYSRRNLLYFDAGIAGLLALRRRDTGRGVELDLDMSGIPPEAALRTLFPRAAGGQASADEQQRFAMLWQARVRCMLLEHADDPGLIRMQEWPGGAAVGRHS
ncbi:MAG: hypothetical protein IT480_15505 [Gammaproteobacteria bacterium]|nr:hypothetical protein [Gammaproteobacteria bacterium]